MYAKCVHKDILVTSECSTSGHLVRGRVASVASRAAEIEVLQVVERCAVHELVLLDALHHCGTAATHQFHRLENVHLALATQSLENDREADEDARPTNPRRAVDANRTNHAELLPSFVNLHKIIIKIFDCFQ